MDDKFSAPLHQAGRERVLPVNLLLLSLYVSLPSLSLLALCCEVKWERKTREQRYRQEEEKGEGGGGSV